MRKILRVLSTAALLSSGLLLAHQGHVHVMGTIAKVDATRLEMKTKDGKAAEIHLPGESSAASRPKPAISSKS